MRVLVVWIEDQTSHNIPLNQSLIQNEALTLQLGLREMKVLQKMLEAIRSWFMKFKERCLLHNLKAQVKQQVQFGSCNNLSRRFS